MLLGTQANTQPKPWEMNWGASAKSAPAAPPSSSGNFPGVILPAPHADKPQEPPSGYKWTADGNLQAITGGPADPNRQTAPMPVAPTSAVHGADFLKTLPPGIAAQVQALTDGRLAFPTGTALKDPHWQQLLTDVANFDPTFDSVNYNSRAATRRDFTSGKDAANITALNTALGHAGTFMDAADNLGNLGGIATPLNAPRNLIRDMTGDPRVGNFNTAKQAFASELERVWRGSGGTESEIRQWQSNFDSAKSPEQLKGVLATAAHLLKSRIDALNQQYRQGMGKTADVTELLTPEARDAYGQLMGSNEDASVPFGGIPPQGGDSGTPPPTTPQDFMHGGPGDPSVTTGDTKDVLGTQANAIIDRMIRDPHATIGDLNAALQPIGWGPVDPRQWADARSFQQQHPHYEGSYGGAMKAEPTTAFNRLAGGPVGAFSTGAADAVTLGNLDSLSGNPDAFRQGMDALSAANPKSYTAGEILGSAPAAAGLEAGVGAAAGKLGAQGVARVAPLVGDALYGAGYGAGSNDDDRLEGAVTGGLGGAVGGAVGRGITRAVGRGVRGVSSQAVRTLRDRGVPLTVGQTLAQSGRVGQAVKGVEDRLAGIPVVGSVINARRGEGLQGFNRAALNEGLSPIGGTVDDIGNAGIGQAQDAVGQAYDNALGGVSVTADAPFVNDMGSAMQAGSAIPRTGPEFAHVVESRLSPAFNAGNGTIDGPQIQDIVQGLRGAKFGTDSMGHAAKDAVGNVEDAVTGLVGRQAPQVMPALNNANTAYRNLSVLQDAVNSGTNTEGVFTPAQLNRASSSNTRRFLGRNANARGDRPFHDLGQAGQAILPSKVPDSGTAGRLATLALPAAIGIGGAGAGYAAGDAKSGGGSALALGGLLALGGTRTGQRALTSLLADRPDAFRRIGTSIFDNADLARPLGAGIGSKAGARKRAEDDRKKRR